MKQRIFVAAMLLSSSMLCANDGYYRQYPDQGYYQDSYGAYATNENPYGYQAGLNQNQMRVQHDPSGQAAYYSEMTERSSTWPYTNPPGSTLQSSSYPNSPYYSGYPSSGYYTYPNQGYYTTYPNQGYYTTYPNQGYYTSYPNQGYYNTYPNYMNPRGGYYSNYPNAQFNQANPAQQNAVPSHKAGFQTRTVPNPT